MPTVTWLGFGVHGDEISSMDAAIAHGLSPCGGATDPAIDSAAREYSRASGAGAEPRRL